MEDKKEMWQYGYNWNCFKIRYPKSKELMKQMETIAFDENEYLKNVILREQFEWEMDAVLENGFSDVLMVGRDFVKMLKQDGFKPKAKGDICSGYIPYLLGITDINPLPIVGENMTKEVMFGFYGNKVPKLHFSLPQSFRGQIDFCKYLKKICGVEDVIPVECGTKHADAEYYLVPEGQKRERFLEVPYEYMDCILESVYITYESEMKFASISYPITFDELFFLLETAGIDREIAFNMASKASKGKGINTEEENELREHDVPFDIINICKTARHLPTKADGNL